MSPPCVEKYHYDVYWTCQIKSKHKYWNSGYLKWNPINQLAILYDEDGATILDETFIVGQVIIDKEYVMSHYLVSIISKKENIDDQASKHLSITSSRDQMKKVTIPLGCEAERKCEVVDSSLMKVGSSCLGRSIKRRKFNSPRKIESAGEKHEQGEQGEQGEQREQREYQREQGNSHKQFDGYQYVKPIKSKTKEDGKSVVTQSVQDSKTSIHSIKFRLPKPAINKDSISQLPLSLSCKNSSKTKLTFDWDAILTRPQDTIWNQDNEYSFDPLSSFVQASSIPSLDPPSSLITAPSNHSFDPSSSLIQTSSIPSFSTTTTTTKPYSSPLTSWHPDFLTFPSPLVCNQVLIQGQLPYRAISIPSSFDSLQSYQTYFSRAILEEINHQILSIAVQFYKVLTRILGIERGENKLYQLAKDWMPSSKEKTEIQRLSPNIYFDCTLMFCPSSPQDASHSSSHPLFSSMWILKFPWSEDGYTSKEQEPNHTFCQNDLWIVSSQASFNPKARDDTFFLARSVQHGKPQGAMQLVLVKSNYKFEDEFQIDQIYMWWKTRAKHSNQVHVIHGPSSSHEFSMLDCLDNLNIQRMPLLPILYAGEWRDRGRSETSKQVEGKEEWSSLENDLISTSTSNSSSLLDLSIISNYIYPQYSPHIDLGLHQSTIERTFQEIINKFSPNEDQLELLNRARSWFDARAVRMHSPITLVHGVFGSGKSHLLVILIIFLSKLFNQSLQSESIKILVSAKTNTAVDRILLGLLDAEYDDFLRVGSLKRIDKRILPYAIHRERRDPRSKEEHDWDVIDPELHDSPNEVTTRSKLMDQLDLDRIAIQDLSEMLKDPGLAPSHRAMILEKLDSISNPTSCANPLDNVRVIGATCLATSFEVMQEREFTFVILDECSQIPEPLSLLPLSRFSTRAFILVGDPMQLPHQLKTREKEANRKQNQGDNTMMMDQIDHGKIVFEHGLELEQPSHHWDSLARTLFSRLAHLDHKPIVLRTQYRLHPILSHLSNHLFYRNQLINGVSEDDRAPLDPSMPTLMWVDSKDGQEKIVNGGSVENGYEARIIVRILQHWLHLGWNHRMEPRQIGIICLYKAQAELVQQLVMNQFGRHDMSNQGEMNLDKRTEGRPAEMNQELSSDDEQVISNEIKVSTVDSFQGGERDAIILSCCRTDWRGFSDAAARINVALTRAKRHLVIIGKYETLASSSLWRYVIEHAKKSDPRGFISGHDIFGKWTNHDRHHEIQVGMK